MGRVRAGLVPTVQKVTKRVQNLLGTTGKRLAKGNPPTSSEWEATPPLHRTESQGWASQKRSGGSRDCVKKKGYVSAPNLS